MTKTEKELEMIVAPVVLRLGYQLYDVEYLKEGGAWYLRVYIDHEKGIDLDDCEKVSEAVGEELDRVDPIPTAYSLEVSSCGLERKLREVRHFEAAIGKKIEVNLYQSIIDENGKKRKTVTGILKTINETGILIIPEQEDTKEMERGSAKLLEINFDNIGNAKILFNWEESENG